jgi:hypothetical protein
MQPAWAGSIIVSLDGSDGAGSQFGGASEFDLDGNHLRDFDFSSGFHPNDRPRFQDVEIGPDGQVYIASRRFNSVYRVDYASGNYLDKPGGFLSAPVFMQFRPNGNLLVSNEGFGHGVWEMENTGPGTPWPNGSLFSITNTHRRAVALGPDDKYYVTVFGGDIERYNADGTHDAAYLVFGNSAFTGDIEFVGDDLLVAQQSAPLIKVFDRATGAAGTDIVAGGSGLYRANDLLLLPDGRLLVGNNSLAGDNEVLEFDSATGNYLGVFASFPAGHFPRGLAFVPAAANPPDASSIVAVSVSNSMVCVTFNSVTGQVYDVQLESDLVDNTWTNDPSNENISGTGTSITVKVNSAAGSEGIRVSSEFE